MLSGWGWRSGIVHVVLEVSNICEYAFTGALTEWPMRFSSLGLCPNQTDS